MNDRAQFQPLEPKSYLADGIPRRAEVNESRSQALRVERALMLIKSLQEILSVASADPGSGTSAGIGDIASRARLPGTLSETKKESNLKEYVAKGTQVVKKELETVPKMLEASSRFLSPEQQSVFESSFKLSGSYAHDLDQMLPLIRGIDDARKMIVDALGRNTLQ